MLGLGFINLFYRLYNVSNLLKDIGFDEVFDSFSSNIHCIFLPKRAW